VPIRGARRILRDEMRLPKPGKITVTFGPLVKPNPNVGEHWREIVRLRDEAPIARADYVAVLGKNAGD
jgi:hypothetical protein